MGSPTVQRTKTPAQTLVAHLLAVVDFRASQQPGTRQSCKGEKKKGASSLELLGSGPGRTHLLEAARGEQWVLEPWDEKERHR